MKKKKAPRKPKEVKKQPDCDLLKKLAAFIDTGASVEACKQIEAELKRK